MVATEIILSGLLSGFISLVVAIAVLYIRQRIKKRRLKRAISTELEATGFLDEAIEEEATAVNDFLQISVLEANVDRLGYFQGEQVQYLVNYIGSANRMKNAIELYRAPDGDFDDKPENLPQIIQGEAQAARKNRNKILRAWGKEPDEVVRTTEKIE
jgi:hypothetical protein